MREATLNTIGLGSVIDIFRRGRLPAEPGDLVDRVFGKAGDRSAMVISGANGIVGAGKTMQLGSRLQPFGVPVVALDLPNAPDGIGKQYPGLVRAFGQDGAGSIMENVIRLNYDGVSLPSKLQQLKPSFLLEAIPEILAVKRSHYEIFRKTFPEIEIRSVTSGFPSSELGVGIAHPAFPHEINKVWEIVEPEPSDITKLLWALGLMPVPVSDDWSFVLDVLFCGVTLAGLRYHHANNMPYWKIDKLVRKLVGPNPFRAHDAIGAAGANFLTWSCLHHLGEKYGDVFRPTPELVEHKETGQNWYPPNHFRPLVNWTLEDGERDEFQTWILGPLFQMTSLMLEEKRGHLSHINAIGELCAQFRRGILAVVRNIGADAVIDTVEAYHRLHPEAAGGSWYPDVFGQMDDPSWQQLYVNAEHDGAVGVITISRESYRGRHE
jgi:3-hydroxyacyl-CoA dehydrogenase